MSTIKVLSFEYPPKTYRLNGHARTMKGKRKQDILALMSFELRTKDSLGKGKGVSDVQVPVRIRIGKGDNEGFLGWIRVGLKGTRFFPHALDFQLIRPQGVTFRGTHGSMIACCYVLWGSFLSTDEAVLWLWQ